MAEAAGLVLSGIALTSLMTSCIDILEYFDDGRHWIRDLSLAFSKVDILKARLSQLKDIMPFDPASETPKLPDVPCCNTSRSTFCGLSGIKMILEQTNELCRRYSHHPQSRDEPVIFPNTTNDFHTDRLGYSRQQLPGIRWGKRYQDGWRVPCRFGKQMRWAIHDKRKFGTLISDLDFLLSNIERLVSSLQACDTCVSTKDKLQSMASPNKGMSMSMFVRAKTNLSPEPSIIDESQVQTPSVKSANMSATRRSLPPSSLQGNALVDKFANNDISRGGYISKGASLSPLSEVGQTHVEGNKVVTSVLIAGYHSSDDQDRSFRHLQEMLKIELSAKQSSSG